MAFGYRTPRAPESMLLRFGGNTRFDIADLPFQIVPQAIPLAGELPVAVREGSGVIRTTGAAVLLAAVIAAGCSFGALTPPPRFDHVVIAIEENKSAAQVSGSPYLPPTTAC